MVTKMTTTTTMKMTHNCSYDYHYDYHGSGTVLPHPKHSSRFAMCKSCSRSISARNCSEVVPGGIGMACTR